MVLPHREFLIGPGKVYLYLGVGYHQPQDKSLEEKTNPPPPKKIIFKLKLKDLWVDSPPPPLQHVPLKAPGGVSLSA